MFTSLTRTVVVLTLIAFGIPGYGAPPVDPGPPDIDAASSAAVPLFAPDAPRRSSLGPEAPDVLRQIAVGGRIADLTTITPGTRLRLDLFDDVTLAVEVDAVRAATDDSVFVTGRVDGVEHARFHASAHSGSLAAFIETPGLGTFRVRSLAPDLHLAIEVDSGAYPPCGSGDADAFAVADAGAAAPAEGGCADDGSVIDILVLYTPVARAQAGGIAGITEEIALAVGITNNAYANSQIPLTINLVHCAETPYQENGSYGDHLSRLRSVGDDFMNEAHTLREQYAADMVALMVADSEYCGLAYRMSSPSPGFASSAFSVTTWFCATGNRTFAHELGHNMGCCHDHDNGCSNPAYAHAFGHRFNGNSGNLWRTVMSYSPGTRVTHFSNPTINFDGQPTGVQPGNPDPANNALTISLTRPIIADFRCSATASYGACCLVDDPCFEGDAGECAAAGGSFEGVQSSCATVQCVAGACCMPDASCVVVTGFDACNAIGGTYGGNGESCQAMNCAVTHCTANSTFGGEYISNFFLNTISHSSGLSLYSNFTYIATNLVRGESYGTIVSLIGSIPGDVGGMWIDWNRDLDFDDAGETIIDTWSGAGPYQINLDVPTGATLGPARLRIRVQDSFFNETCVSCGSSVTGEVEDYTVFIVDPSPPTEYCGASGQFFANEYISNVTFGAIDNDSTISLYSDFTSTTAPVLRGDTYTFTATLTAAIADDVGGLWIDWNRNLVLDDPGELITDAWTGSGPYTAQITVPETATPGPARLRVRLQDGSFNPIVQACGNTTIGEVEDYTVEVIDDVSLCPQDLDDNGLIDFGDLLLILNGWGPCNACPEDLDGNGIVGFEDLLVILNDWGACSG